MEMADRVAVLRAGRLEQVDAPDRLYADPATVFVHEFLGESVRLSCTVREGFARFEDGAAPVATTCPPGSAVAVIRAHEIALRPGPGPACITAVHTNGPLRRVHVTLGRDALEVLQTLQEPAPAIGERWNLDLSRARIYPAAPSP
jgi:sulfate transport system ATP-binding protein